ncbi:35925_t:CDS:2, partial [Gigaspora margarita]
SIVPRSWLGRQMIGDESELDDDKDEELDDIVAVQSISISEKEMSKLKKSTRLETEYSVNDKSNRCEPTLLYLVRGMMSDEQDEYLVEKIDRRISASIGNNIDQENSIK